MLQRAAVAHDKLNRNNLLVLGKVEAAHDLSWRTKLTLCMCLWAPNVCALHHSAKLLSTQLNQAGMICIQYAFSSPAGIGLNASAATLEAAAAVKLPDDDGLWLMDTETGSTSLLVSLQQIHRALHQGVLSGRKDSSTGQPYNNTGMTGCQPSDLSRGGLLAIGLLSTCPVSCACKVPALGFGLDQGCVGWAAQCQSSVACLPASACVWSGTALSCFLSS